jgi:4-carboxymuconolactone decarboxylase
MKTFAATAVSFSVLASACAPTGIAQDAQAVQVKRLASPAPALGPLEHFTGSVRVDPLFEANDASGTSSARVTFAPGARTAWHSHTRGQTLIVTSGSGRLQRWGDPVQDIREGDVVWIPPGQKHWHGASPNSSMSHIGIVENPGGKGTEWMELVSDSQYGVPARSAPATAGSSSRTQSLMGDIAPKLAELTEKVLYDDVWQRPQLSQRDRSLVTVAALIAMNRPDQLRSHLAMARANGVTQDELIETITHLAFYVGWPNAVTAITVAKEVFKGN